jgi:hypothetical protein
MRAFASGSPRSMRFASSTSCDAVSSGYVPIWLRNSWSASCVAPASSSFV